jgi:chromosome segregation ATPase
MHTTYRLLDKKQQTTDEALEFAKNGEVYIMNKVQHTKKVLEGNSRVIGVFKQGSGTNTQASPPSGDEEQLKTLKRQLAVTQETLKDDRKLLMMATHSGMHWEALDPAEIVVKARRMQEKRKAELQAEIHQLELLIEEKKQEHRSIDQRESSVEQRMQQMLEGVRSQIERLQEENIAMREHAIDTKTELTHVREKLTQLREHAIVTTTELTHVREKLERQESDFGLRLFYLERQLSQRYASCALHDRVSGFRDGVIRLCNATFAPNAKTGTNSQHSY